MTKARGVFGLQLAVGAAGAAATVLALRGALRGLSLHPPDGGALAEACRAFVIPHLTVGSVLALVLGSAAFAVVALAARSAARQLRARRSFFASLRVLGPAPVGPPGTMLFAGQRPQAFCAGLLCPRVYLSEGTLGALNERELEAVLAHEAHHARHRDPLRVFFARMLTDALFFLPVLRPLSERYAALAELAADSAAVRRTDDDPQPLAGALLAFDRGSGPAVIGIAPERVDHLLGERPGWDLPLALLAWSLVIAGVLVAVAVRVGDATAHASVSLPLVVAQLCMFAMAVAPLAAGAGVLLACRRVQRTRPRA